MGIGEMYQLPFMQQALLGGVLAGAILSYLGLFILLRRIVFVGAALPQIAAFGVALAISSHNLFGLHIPALAGGICAAVGGVALLSWTNERGRIPPDGVVGILYAAAGTLSILVLALATESRTHIHKLITGDILGTTSVEIVTLTVSFGLIGLIHLLFWKPFKIISFDADLADAMRMNRKTWDALLFFTIGVSVALCMRVVGSVVSFAFLIGPAATCLLLFRSFRYIIPATIAIGVLSAFCGLTVSFWFDLPSGPSIAAFSLLPLLPAWIVNKF